MYKKNRPDLIALIVPWRLFGIKLGQGIYYEEKKLGSFKPLIKPPHLSKQNKSSENPNNKNPEPRNQDSPLVLFLFTKPQMASNITKEYSESLCADIQSLFLMTVKLPAVTPEIAHQALALWLYLEKEIPQTVSTILLSDKKEKNLWGICCPCWSTTDYSLQDLILEAEAAVAHLLQAEDSHLPPSAVDLMLLKTREVIGNNQASKSVPFLKNELVKSEFYQNLRTCAGLCAELVPKAHQPANSHQGTIDFVEDRSLTIKVPHPIVKTDLQMAITRYKLFSNSLVH